MNILESTHTRVSCSDGRAAPLQAAGCGDTLRGADGWEWGHEEGTAIHGGGDWGDAGQL